MEGLFLLNRLLLSQSLHAQADFAVLDTDNLNSNLLALFQNHARMLDSLSADLRYMQKTGQTVVQIYKCAVVLQAVNCTLDNSSNLYSSHLCSLLFLFLLLHHSSSGQNQLFVLRNHGNRSNLQMLAYHIL